MNNDDFSFSGPAIRNVADVANLNDYFWQWWNSVSLIQSPLSSNTQYQHTYLEFVNDLRELVRHVVMKHLVCVSCRVRLNGPEHAREHFHHKLINDGNIHSDDCRRWSQVLFVRHYYASEQGLIYESHLLKLMNEYVVELGLIVDEKIIVGDDEIQRCIIEIIQLDKQISELVADFLVKDHINKDDSELDIEDRDVIIGLSTSNVDLKGLKSPDPVIESQACFPAPHSRR